MSPACRRIPGRRRDAPSVTAVPTPDRRAAPLRPRRRRARGGSLLVLVVWTVLLLFGALALAKSIVTSAQVQKQNEETALACEGATRQLEILKSVPFGEVFERYNASAADNPGTGASPGASFAVPGLSPMPNDADGLEGEIVFPVNASDGTRISESATGLPGFPRDLNLDGDAADTTLASSAILPVVVRVRWRSAGGGERVTEISTTLGEP